MAAKRLKTCPLCGSSLRTVWTNGRKLQQTCSSNEEDPDCTWEGKPFTPEKRPIRTVKTVPLDGGWEYEGFDQYGHTFVHSHSFSSKKACLAAAKKEIEKYSKDPHYGKCTAIVWPPTTTVRGIKVA